MSVNRLSTEQRRFFVTVLDRYRQAEQATGRWADWHRRGVESDGVGLDPGGRRYGVSRSDSASRSRSLRRLQARGLITLHNRFGCWDKQMRATHVRLTEKGRAVAAALAEEAVGEETVEETGAPPRARSRPSKRPTGHPRKGDDR